MRNIGEDVKPVKPQNQMTKAECDFWARYAQCLVKRCITGHKAEWHVRRAQQFCYSLDGKRLREVSEKDLEAYTHVLNRPGLTARSPADLKRIGL